MRHLNVGSKFIFEVSPSRESLSNSDFIEMLQFARQVSITSHPKPEKKGLGRSLRHAEKIARLTPYLNITLHVTCNDITKRNAKNVLEIIAEHLQVETLLLISGQHHYQQLENEISTNKTEHNFVFDKDQQIHFTSSLEMLKFVENLNLFSSLQVAAYPNLYKTNDEQSVELETHLTNLEAKVDCGARQVVTQILFDVKTLIGFEKILLDKLGNDKFQQIQLVPSVALFESSDDLDKVCKLTGVSAPQNLRDQLKAKSINESKENENNNKVSSFCLEFISELCFKLLTECKNVKKVNICTFNKYKFSINVAQKVASIIQITSNNLDKPKIDNPNKPSSVFPNFDINLDEFSSNSEKQMTISSGNSDKRINE